MWGSLNEDDLSASWHRYSVLPPMINYFLYILSVSSVKFTSCQIIFQLSWNYLIAIFHSPLVKKIVSLMSKQNSYLTCTLHRSAEWFRNYIEVFSILLQLAKMDKLTSFIYNAARMFYMTSFWSDTNDTWLRSNVESLILRDLVTRDLYLCNTITITVRCALSASFIVIQPPWKPFSIHFVQLYELSHLSWSSR